MASSQAETVDEFMAELPEERREALIRLRALCRNVLTGFTEEMRYGMPCYRRGAEVPEFAFQSQKHYISLYVCDENLRAEHPELWEGLNCGKGCIRFKKPEQIDFDRVRKILQAIRASSLHK